MFYEKRKSFMSRTRDLQRTNYILFSIEKIELFIGSKTLIDFEGDFILQGAIQYHFLIIGEAVGAISKTRLEKYDYPWYIPKSFRNFIIHEYHSIKLERIYLATKDMGELKEICLLIKDDLEA